MKGIKDSTTFLHYFKRKHYNQEISSTKIVKYHKVILFLFLTVNFYGTNIVKFLVMYKILHKLLTILL